MNPLVSRLVALIVWLAAGAAVAAEVEVCFDYGCSHHATAVFSAPDIAVLRETLGEPASAEDERARVGEAIGRMYAMAGTQTPIFRDRGRNTIDERASTGAMDCIDHSTNSDAFLRVLGDAGLLRFHRPGERARRFAFLVFGEHWTATLVENDSGQAFAVDSWFFDPGFPAMVVPLARWKEGYDPGNKFSGAP